MDRLHHQNLRPTLTLASLAVGGVGLGLGAVLAQAPLALVAAPILVGLGALVAIKGEPIGRSSLSGAVWRIRYGRTYFHLPLAQIAEVRIYPQEPSGDRVFVTMLDGRVLPLPEVALPPLSDLCALLRAQGIAVRR